MKFPIILLLFYIPLIYAQQTPVDFYNKINFGRIGNVYVKANGYFSSNNVAIVSISDILNSTTEQLIEFDVRVIDMTEREEAKGSCSGDLPQIKCSVDLSQNTKEVLKKGYLEIKVKMKDGTNFLLLKAYYYNYKFAFKPFECRSDYQTSQVCVCMQGFYEKVDCKDYIPTPCYKLDVTMKVKDLEEYTKPAVKLEFKEPFNEANIEPKSLYVYDDSTFQFYALSYQKVEDGVDARPVGTDQFRLKFHIATITEEINPSKENYIIANFPINNIISFQNAFCKKSSSNIIICVCCEYSETDPFCKTSHSDNEVKLYTSAQIDPERTGDPYNERLWIIGAKAWTSRNKKRVNIQFFDAMQRFYKTTTSETFTIRYKGVGDTGYSINKECKSYYRDFPCYFDFDEKTDRDGKVYLYWCARDKKCSEVVNLVIKGYSIDMTLNDYQKIPCQFETDGYVTKCICPPDVDASQVKVEGTSKTYTCVPTAKQCPTSGNPIFRVKFGDENFISSMQQGGSFYFKHTPSRDNPIKNYVVTFEPMTTLPLKKRLKNDGWATKIWISSFGLTGSEGEVFVSDFLQNTEDLYGMPYSYCEDKGKAGDLQMIECFCCDEQLNSCPVTDEYDFYFANDISGYGILTGSGIAWSTRQKLYAQINELNVYDDSKNALYLGANLKSCIINVGKICSATIPSTSLFIKWDYNSVSASLVEFTFEGDNKIKINDPNNGCAVVPKSGAKIQYCICESGKRTDQNCPIQQNTIQQCSLGPTNNNNPPQLTFDSNWFKKPEDFKNPVSQYLTTKDSSKIYQLAFEPIKEFAKQHPSEDPVFLLGMSISQCKDCQQSQFPLIETNFETSEKLWSFPQAFCQSNLDKIECTCCEGDKSGNSDICLNAKTMSETNVKFSMIVSNYGFLMVQFKLTLNSLGRFTLKNSGPTIKEFSQNFRLKFLKNKDLSDVQYCKWPECLFNFKAPLNTGDKIQLSIELLKSDETVLTNSNQIDAFSIDGNKIKEQGKENECYLYQNHDKYAHICSCPKDHDFDGNCGEMEPIQCQKIDQINKIEIKNKTRIFPSFYLKMGDPGENNPTFVFDEKNGKYYTFSYTVNKGSDSTKPVYKISIGPTKSTQTLTNTLIQINFNFSFSLIQFNDVSCSFANNEWLCECCSEKDCSSNDPNINFKTSTIKPTTKNPSNNNPSKNPPTTKKPSKTAEERCKNKPANKETSELCDIDKTKIDSSTIDTVTKEIKKAINPQKATADDIAIAGDIISKMADVKDATVEQRKSTIELFDHILESKEESFKENGRDTSDTYINAMDKILTESKEDINYLNGSNLGAEKKKLNCEDSESWTGILDDSQKFDVRNGGINPGDGIASIELNKETLCKNSAENLMQSIYFVIYRNGKLFQADDKGDGKERDEAPDDIKSSSNSRHTNRCKKGYGPTNGFILSSVVSNKNASINARLRFKKEDFKLPPHSNLAVTWWDKTEWSENKQCKFKLEGDEYVAHCDHLTNFALLVEKSSTDPLLCDTVLDKLGFWLCILSLVALFILALIYLTRLIPIVKDSALVSIVNNQRRSGADTLIIVYVLIMLMFYFFFTIFIDQSMTNSKVFCKITAAFLYFLFLSAMFLNLFQAWDMIKMCSWNSQMENILQIMTRIYVVLPVSFGLPFLIVITVFFADGTFFFRDDQFCWIRPQSIIFAVLIPVTLMLLNSFIAFGIFCVRMFPDFFKRFGIKGSSVQLAKGEKQARRMNLELFIVLLFAQFILGFPWILQYPAMFSSGSTAWHYLFAIFNGTNGIILFLIYFYGRAMAFYRLRRGNNSTGNTRSTNVNSQTNNGQNFDEERRESIGSDESEDSF